MSPSRRTAELPLVLGAPSAGRVALGLVSPRGGSLAWDASGWDARRLAVELPVDGPYLVRVRDSPAGRPAPYELTLRTRRETPGRLELDRPAAGVFDGVEPKLGLWEFDGAAGQAVAVSAGSEAFDAGFEVLSPSGDVIMGTRPRSRSRRRSVLPASARYRVGGRVDGAVLLPASGRYRVRVIADDDSSGGYEVAVRSTGVTPRPIELDAPAAGVHEGGVDYWRFEGARGRLVNVSATASANDALMGLDVMSPVGEIVARTDSPLRDHALVRLPVDGPYVIRVWSRRGSRAGPYEVAVWSVAPPPALEMGTPAAGTLDYHGPELGFWAFESAAGGRVRISVVADGFEPVIQLFSPTGERLVSTHDDDEDRARLEALLPVPGRYVVRVRATYGRSGYGEGEYEVTVEPVVASPR